LFSACDGGAAPKVFDDTGDLPGNLVVAETELDFGAAEDVGETLEAQLSLQNTGDGDIEVTSLVFEGPFSGGITGLTVSSQSSVAVGLYFLPTDYEEVTGTLTVFSDDPDTPEIVVSLVGSVVLDADEDGHERLEAGGDDCDDSDPSANPGSDEIWYDGVDQDCDGGDDYDQDGDGFQSVVFNADPDAGGGDCNDVVDYVHPGAEDTWYDGVDSDCDGSGDWDADGDGFSSAALNKGSDCDDLDGEIYPGAEERFNGVKDDCNGDVDAEIRATAADYSWTGASAEERYGRGLGAGDLDGDGWDDIVAGAPDYNTAGGLLGRGAVAVYLSSYGLPADGSDLQSAWHLFQGQNATSGLGEGVQIVTDYNGNGQGDLLVGAPGDNSYGGVIYVIDSSAVLAWGSSQNRHTEIRGGSGLGYYVGRSIAPDADLDGDGLSDVLFDYASSSSTSASGNFGLQYGGAIGIINLSDVDVLLSIGTNSSDPTKENLAAAKDIDADGYDDWVYGDAGNDSQGNDSGAVWVLWGQSTQYAGNSLSSVFEQVVAAEASGGAGYSTALLDDLDGDGAADLAWWHEADSELHLVSGASLRNGGIQGPSDSFASLGFSNGVVPGQVASIGDWDGDSASEWILTLDGEDGGGNGNAFIYSGAGLSGSYEGDESFLASFKPKGDDFSVDFGDRVVPGGADVNQDGRADMITSDTLYEGDVDGDATEDTEAGSVYVFLNPAL